MSLTSSRWVALVVLFAITFLIGTLPVFGFYYWKRRKDAQKDATKATKQKMVLSTNTYVQVLTQVGGGVLFYTVLAHMMPEILESYETYLESNSSVFRKDDTDSNSEDNKPSLPIVELVMCGGFFLVYLVEELMHTFFFHAHYHDLNDNQSINKDIKIITKSERPASFGTFDGQVNNGFDGSTELVAASHNSKHSNIMLTDISVTTRQRKKSMGSNSYCSEIEIIRTQNAEEKPLWVRIFDGIVIILAFSVHSLFDGISIGIQTSVSEVWTMFIAIASHKLLIAFILSVELYEKCGNFLLMSFYMLLFSIMSPIGIFIVIIMEQSLNDSSLVVVLLSALSAGTILYIVFFEILQKDRVKNLSGIVQFISMLVGFGLMFAVSYIFQE